MAYNNPFFYNRDSSVDSRFSYVADLSSYKPLYGSSVSFKSRLNSLEMYDNSLKVLPASENNLVLKFNLVFLLKDDELGNLLRTIEIAGGYKNLKFTDPSNFYKDVIGLVEDYTIKKQNSNINELNISVASYFKAPIFNWRTSSILDLNSINLNYSSFANYKKNDFVYYNPKDHSDIYAGEINKIDNFWFAKSDMTATNNYTFNTTNWTKKFNYDFKFPFELKNKLDFYQMDYKNSFIQNIKHKENSNSLKEFEFKAENISDRECRSILFFLEKKCGYRRFIYLFPFMLKKSKIFICTQWNHSLKYYDCNDITATFVEDPNPNINIFKFIDSDYYSEFSMTNPYPTNLTSN